MDNVLFESTEYKITQANFTYQGHSEPLGNIAGLTIIEWSMKDRMKYALGLGLFSLVMFYTIGWFLILPILYALSQESSFPWVETATLLVFIVFSLVGYIQRKGYSLELESKNGNKGTIGKSPNTLLFDELLIVFSQAKKLEHIAKR